MTFVSWPPNDSVSYLYQLAGKHRYASALMAARIEATTREAASRSGGRLEALTQESLALELFVALWALVLQGLKFGSLMCGLRESVFVDV
ncbi:MAG: hypothetical protein V2I24_10615 [Halieaceae bacterium]|jgi:hypothetical protein|nr:hypothetical protein [Halieaceae bacterium]